MKIVHINTNDIAGGAGRAAFRLHTAMRADGIDSKMFVLNKFSQDNEFIERVGKTKLTRLHAILKISKERFKIWNYRPFGVFSIASSGFKLASKEVIRSADIIYLHWFNSGLLNIREVGEILKLGKPVYWVLHDMWPFTGGCHHSFDCNRYIDSCGNCVLLKKNSSPTDITTKVLAKKQKYWSSFKNLHIITPSIWLGRCASKSKLFGLLNVDTIPNTIDMNMYSPMNKGDAREKFGLRPHTKVILFGADAGANNPYKGWSYMQEALENIKKPNMEAVVFGSILPQEIINCFPMPVKCVGSLKSDIALACLYSAADVFVTPSLVDNLPNTIVESMACNTPVVGFNIGGIPDLIEHKRTGYLASYKDAQDLQIGIEWVTSLPKENFNAREAITKIVAPERIVGLHKKLWERDLS